MFEAARVDGAGWFRTHWHVTLPMMRSIIVFYLVIEAITLLSWVFSYVFVMTGGGPGQATQVTETYIYQNAFTYRLPWLAACRGDPAPDRRDGGRRRRPGRPLRRLAAGGRHDRRARRPARAPARC